ncbi:O-antigen ligase family protein [Litoreibacter sp.]|nr:O-antigen ligase family protein [Litoreibacter sp.]
MSATTQTTAKLTLPVLIYLASVVIPVRFMVGPLQLTSVRLILLLMLPALLWPLLTRPRIMPDVLLMLIIPWVFVAMWMNTPAQAIEHTGITAIEMLGGYALARLCIRTHAQFETLIRALVILILLCLPLALFETFTGHPIFIQLIRAVPGLSSVDIVTIAPRLGLERVQAVFAHPIHFGLFCSTGISLLFVGMSGSLSLTTRLAGLSLITLTTFLALSSGAFLSVIIQLFLIGWSLIFARTNHKWLILTCVCIAGYIFIDLVSNRTPLRVFFSYATFSAHNAYWRGIIFEWGMINVWNNPVFGIGLNDWERPHFMHSGSMDNFWLWIAVRYGIPGFLMMSAAWIIGIIRVARGPAHPLKTAWLFCMIGLTFTLCTVHVWTAVYSFVFFLLGAGQFLSSTQPDKPDPKPAISPAFHRPFRSNFSRPPQAAQ